MTRAEVEAGIAEGRMAKPRASSKRLESAMREVHEDMPSTVKRAKHFGPKGREGMLRAVAYSKVRKRK